MYSSSNVAATRAVMDASVAAKWVLQEQSSTQARTLLREWLANGVQPVAPSWFACEVANVLHQNVRRGVATAPDARELLRRLLAVVSLVHILPGDAIRASDIARITAQPTPYDAQYLAVAERLGCDY